MDVLTFVIMCSCVLASELLREAERLVEQRIHPQTIIEGYRIASKSALEALKENAKDHRWAATTFYSNE